MGRSAPEPPPLRSPADRPCLEDVKQRVESAVARTLGYDQRLLIEHEHEPRRVAARGDVARPVCVAGAHQHERGEGYKRAAVTVQALELLADRELARHPHNLAQLRLRPDGVVESARSWHGKGPLF